MALTWRYSYIVRHHSLFSSRLLRRNLVWFYRFMSRCDILPLPLSQWDMPAPIVKSSMLLCGFDIYQSRNHTNHVQQGIVWSEAENEQYGTVSFSWWRLNPATNSFRLNWIFMKLQIQFSSKPPEIATQFWSLPLPEPGYLCATQSS